MEDIETRVISLEQWRATQEALSVERNKHMDERFDKLESSIKDVNGHLTKIVWLIVTSIVVGIMAFILQGGLSAAG